MEFLNTEMKNATLQLMLFSVRRKRKNITCQSKQSKKEMNTEYAKDLLRHNPATLSKDWENKKVELMLRIY